MSGVRTYVCSDAEDMQEAEDHSHMRAGGHYPGGVDVIVEEFSSYQRSGLVCAEVCVEERQ